MTARATAGTQPLLLVSYYFPPAIAAGAQRASRWARYLPEFGYRPHVITAGVGSSEDRTEVTYVDPPPVKPDSFKSAAILAGQMLLSAYNDRIYWAWPAFRAAERLLLRSNAEVVVSSSPPICTHIVGLWLKLRHGVKWVADFRDPFSSSPGRGARRNRILDPFLERLIFRNADRIIGVTDAMIEEWGQRYPQYRSKLQVIWNGFDPCEAFPPRSPQAGCVKTVAHIGDCYGPRHPGRMLDSLARLIDGALIDSREVRVALTGPLDDTSPVRSYKSFNRLRAQGVLLCEDRAVPRAEALQATVDADLLVILDLHGSQSGYAAPSKVFDYIRAGRPILAYTPRNSTLLGILSRSGVPHMCIFPDEPQESADAKVQSFLQMPSGPHSPNNWFLETFDGRRQSQDLAKLLSGIPAIPPMNG